MSMPNKLFPAAAVALFALAACNDRQMPSAPPTIPPPPSGNVSAMLQGYVDGKTGTATFTPLGMAPSLFGSVSPSIYGTQGVNLSIFGVIDSIITVAGTSRIWYIRLGVRNLLAYPIGSNYPNAAPPDSSGVFVGFTVLPNVAVPSPCACTIIVNNPMGKAQFTAPGQPYYWYNSRPTAVQASPGTDTTKNNPEWQFKATTFAGADTANSFSFVLLVNAAWPPPNETTWSATYDGTVDTLPDANGKPRWKKFASTGVPTLGTETWSASGLAVNAADNVHSIYFGRHDSLGINSAFLKATGSVTAAGAPSTNYKAVFGFVEPQGGVPTQRQVFIGIADTRVGFVSFNNGTGQWSTLSSTTIGGAFNGNISHTYTLRKIGNTSAALCVDGVQQLTRAYGGWDTVRNNFNTYSVVWGADGRAGGALSVWTNVSYTIGSSGSCP